MNGSTSDLVVYNASWIVVQRSSIKFWNNNIAQIVISE